MTAAPQAVIDIGTNTIRLLVARRRPDGGLERLDDQTETVRLGQGVDGTGRLAGDRMQRAADTVARFAARARAAGAAEPVAIATSAVRDALNRDALVALVRVASGLAVEIVSGDREAALTFRGALAGRAVAGRQVVADIGGGSTEIILAEDGAVRWAISLQLGSGRLTERCLPSDPPAPAEVAAARAQARAALPEVPAADIDALTLVGGTASAVLALTARAPGDDRLTRDQLAGLLGWALSRPADVAAAEGRLDPTRARVLPGGLLIIEAIMQQFEMNTVFISRGGIREGVLLSRQ